MKCCIPCCTFSNSSTNSKDEPITIHRFPFPKNQLVRNKWIQITKVIPKSSTFICSSHFEPHYIRFVGGSLRLPKLTHYAVPTLNLPKPTDTESKEKPEADMCHTVLVSSLTTNNKQFQNENAEGTENHEGYICHKSFAENLVARSHTKGIADVSMSPQIEPTMKPVFVSTDVDVTARQNRSLEKKSLRAALKSRERSIKTIMQKIRRQTKKITSMAAILKALRQKHSVRNKE